jgi:hypothetical protein
MRLNKSSCAKARRLNWKSRSGAPTEMETQMNSTGSKNLKPMLATAGVIALAACAYAPAKADADAVTSGTGSLVNISTPEIVAPKQLGLKADVRVFGGDENTTYLGVGVRYGLSQSWELGVGSSLAQFESFTTAGGAVIRHAGSDVELSAKYASHQSGKFDLSGEIGVGLPNTPSQKSAHLTTGLMGSMKATSNIDLYINPRVVFISNNSIVGVGFGAKVKFTKQFSLVGDYTPILGGANTVDVNTDTYRSRDIYGAAIRYAAGNGNTSIDLGWTNGTGFTTGSSLTPGLGNSSAFYVSVNFKR